MNDTATMVTRQDDGTTAILTIDRPERRNALNQQVKIQLLHALDDCIADRNIAVVILTGAGGIFVAGSDIAEMVDLSAEDQRQQDGGRIFLALRDCPKPLIAAVEGYALGGGCELALSCDIVVAAAGARFGQPEIRVGIMPGGGGTQLLLRAIGPYRAARLLLTGDTITATEAHAMGMISEVTADKEALARAQTLAAAIGQMPPLAVKAIKHVLRQGQDLPLSQGLALERSSFIELFDSEDQAEGMTAFLEKRSPRYQGR